MTTRASSTDGSTETGVGRTTLVSRKQVSCHASRLVSAAAIPMRGELRPRPLHVSTYPDPYLHRWPGGAPTLTIGDSIDQFRCEGVTRVAIHANVRTDCSRSCPPFAAIMC